MKKFFYMSIFLLTLANVNLSQESLDKIVAIVDNEIIMKSELDLQVNLEAAQRRLNPADKSLKSRILDAMINQKLLYAQAELDSIEITDEEVSQQLDMQMNYFISQYGSKERVEKTYGMSIDRIKREFRADTRKQLMAERVKQTKFGGIEVSRIEVNEFYQEFKDSLGLIPERFHLYHIFINPKASSKVEDRAKSLANKLLDSLKSGADFAELAKEFSDDPGSATQGGDLGTVKRGKFFPEYEAVAYSLKKGQLSSIVKSPVGYHIIELLERKGDAIHTRHILVKPKSDDEADLKSIEFLSDIRDSVLNSDKGFEYFAKTYSDDKETAKFGGDLGTFEVDQLDKSLRDKVYSMKVGDVSFPKRLDLPTGDYGFHIIKVESRTSEHVANIDQDYQDIKRLAEFRKREKLYNKWIEDLRSTIYWESNI